MNSRIPIQGTLCRLDRKRSEYSLRIANVIKRRSKALSPLFRELMAYSHFAADADHVVNSLTDPLVTALLLPDPLRRVRLAFAFKKSSQNTIYSSGAGEGLLSWRDRSALLIESSPGKAIAWNGFRSITGVGTGKYSKHINKTNSASFYYSENANPAMLEFKVFSSGIGYFCNPSRIFMYGRFNFDIGETVKTNRRNCPTRVLKLQIDRVSRPKIGPPERKRRQGYFLKCHGFPISITELERDFPKGAAAVKAMAFTL